MVRLFDTAAILGVRKPLFPQLPRISTNSTTWTNSDPSHAWRKTSGKPTTELLKSISSLETSFSPAKTIDSLRHHRWSGTFPFPSLLSENEGLTCRPRRSLYFSSYHRHLCSEYHFAARPYNKNVVSDPTCKWSCHPYHEAIPSPPSSSHNLGGTILFRKVCRRSSTFSDQLDSYLQTGGLVSLFDYSQQLRVSYMVQTCLQFYQHILHPSSM